VRNTKVVDVIKALKDYGMKVSIYDPWAEPKEVMHEYGLTITNTLPNKKFDAVVLGVSHKEFIGLNFNSILKTDSVLYDVKGVLESEVVDGKL
jgi:UDP-N-acetyl-D-galactosamine dehydrogenase